MTKYEDSFPKLEMRWRPVVESNAKVELFGGAVVMSTRADLVVETTDGHLVRETKSVGAHHEVPQSAAEVFERYPQVAVTLCMLADGLDPVTGAVVAEARPARVEVEILRPDGVVVELDYDARNGRLLKTELDD